MERLDKIFKAYDIRGVYRQDLDENTAWKVGYASAQFLRTLLSGYDRGQASANRLVIGRDMRPHGEGLTRSLIEGVLAGGLSCANLGQIDTPMIYFAINHLGACGGIQVTASHNPIQYNGFKISGQKARPVGSQTGLKEIQHIVSTMRRTQTHSGAVEAQEVNLWPEYRRHVQGFLHLDRPLKVAIDASNGMAGKMVPLVLEGSAMEVVPLNFQIGVDFAHDPNPLIEANLRQLQQAVTDNAVDFGVCFDGDADRCMFVDETGRIVRSDHITALLARHFLRLHPGSTVVYDLRSSRVVPEEIRAAGGVTRRERVGHAFMKKALADTHAIFGGELSGHFYFRDNYNADSGAIVLAVVASVVSGQDHPFSELIAPLKRYVQSGEINFKVEDKPARMEELAALFPDGRIDRLDGVTVDFADWWFNVRASNTEPLLRLNVEAANEQQLDDKLKQIEEVLGQPVEE